MMLLFEFEKDFADSLRCIPMALRYKLDSVGIKLKLTHWNLFSKQERQVLLAWPWESPQDRDRFRDFLQALVTQKSGEPAGELGIEPTPAWLQEDHIPESVQSKAAAFKFTITAQQWQKLQPLQRFALVKLSQSSHENHNFLPALREFNLISE